MIKRIFTCFVICIVFTDLYSQDAASARDKHRPQFHFTPRAHWMNDPNGLVYNNGTWHLFFQYFPGKSVWGPMHWGHATSTDLVNWQEQAVALYPDSLGWIFSGSAVIDFNNTSGLGKNGKPPMVAIFTHHKDSLEKLKQNNHQYQSLAYSNDEGNTWTKYEGNPVLKNPGIQDFRDPKVMWYEQGKKWIMTLATKDRISFYSSPDLKAWSKESEFGADFGGHGGVWECPDLFQLPYDGGSKWILLVSINPGGPNGGSVTQYFTGNFDGKNFIPTDTMTRWMDHGPDNYAGVTWSNTGKRKILLGWMSNWLYAEKVPTEKWRSATTVPRELSLVKISGKPVLAETPVAEFAKIQGNKTEVGTVQVNGKTALGSRVAAAGVIRRLSFESEAANSVALVLSNKINQQVAIGYDHTKNQFYIDRTNSGSKGFSDEFFKKAVAPRNSINKTVKFDLVIDDASVELFADNGTTVMTSIFFPNEKFRTVELEGKGAVKNVTVYSTKN